MREGAPCDVFLLRLGPYAQERLSQARKCPEMHLPRPTLGAGCWACRGSATPTAATAHTPRRTQTTPPAAVCARRGCLGECGGRRGRGGGPPACVLRRHLTRSLPRSRCRSVHALPSSHARGSVKGQPLGDELATHIYMCRPRCLPLIGKPHLPWRGRRAVPCAAVAAAVCAGCSGTRAWCPPRSCLP